MTLKKLINKIILVLHKKNNKQVTLTAVQPPARFGALDIEKDLVTNFKEKPTGDNAWINGGFFVFNSKIFKYLSKNQMLERQPIKKLLESKTTEDKISALENIISFYLHDVNFTNQTVQ